MLKEIITAFKYKNLWIRYKIIVVFIPLMIIPLLLVIYFSNTIITQSVTEKTKKYIAEEQKLIVMRIDEMYSNTEVSANRLSRDIDEIYSETSINDPDPKVLYNLTGKVETALNYNIRPFKDIESAIFIDLKENLFRSFVVTKNDNDKMFEKGILKTLLETKSPFNIWFPLKNRSYLVTDTQSPVLTLGKRVVSANTGDLIGFIVLNIKQDTLSSFLPVYDKDEEREFFILDREGDVISSNKLSLDIKAPIDSKNFIVTSNLITNLDWKLINRIPISKLNSEVSAISIFITVLGVISILVVLFMSFFLAKFIANPIIKLTRIAKEVRRGNLNVNIITDSSDEVGILTSVFREMMSRIKELLFMVESDQRKKREFELALLQAQIKPHFLYNTLDLIYVLSEMGDGKKAAKTTKALAGFYRISLSKGKEIIPLKDEIKNVQDYLSIQKERYSDILDFKFQISKEIMNFSILKLTIQPLVENAIYHGIKPKSTPGFILIEGFEKADLIIIKVTDNGVGISKETLQQLLHHNVGANSFGLKSVHERIKLYFGEEYGLDIVSEAGRGTEVTIKIPHKVGLLDG